MSGLLTVKLGRDVRASWSRFLLMVIGNAVSLTVVGGVLLVWATTTQETRGAYLSTEPASATILFDQPVDAERMAELAAQAAQRPQIIAAVGRTQFNSEVEVNGRQRRIPLQLFVAAQDDPMRIANFEVEPGAWPPAAGEVLIARDSLALLGIVIGDTVTVDTPGGDELPLRVAGTVYDPSLSPSPQEQTGRGYLSTESLATAGNRPELDQLKVQVAKPGQREPTRERDAIISVGAGLGDWLQREQGLAVREVQVPPPAKHPHQWQADSLLLSMLVGGGAALLLSTILVANMLNILFTQQRRQIGIMKAIGARSGRIGRLYLAMALIVASAATLLALGPAILIGRNGSRRFLGFLGIEASSYSAPLWTYLVLAAVGLGLPPLMALLPIVKASRTTVRAAINHDGTGAPPISAAGLLARLGRLRHLDRGMLMALRNTARRPARTFLSASLLASAGVVFVAGISLGAGVKAVADEQKERTNWDVDVELVAPAPIDEVRTVLDRVDGLRFVEGFQVVTTGLAGPGRIAITRTYPDQGHGRVSLTAVSAGAMTFRAPKLLEGRWLEPGETGAIVLNQIARKNTVPGTRAGDTVQLSLAGTATTWRVVGIIEERGGHSGVYATPEGLADAVAQPQQVNRLRIAGASDDEEARRRMAGSIERALTDSGVGVKTATSVSQSQAISAGHLGPVISIILAISIAMGIVGGIGLAATMSANILDRTREFGVMHAIGAPRRAVRRIVVAEGVFLSLMSCLVAVIPTLLLSRILQIGLGNLFFSAPLPYRISSFAVAIWLVIVSLAALLATDAAAARASRVTVRDALAYI